MFKSNNLFIVPLILIAIFSNHLYGQSREKVYRYCYVIKSKDWYQNQADLWKSEILTNPQNEDAWYNYFFAARYGWADVKGRTYTRETLMDSIYNEMGKFIPDSWVYHYIHYYNYGTDFSRLQKAFQINPNEPDLYWEFIKEYELTGRTNLRKEFCEKLYNSKAISSGLLNLDCNMLNSTEPNSILFTNGDNDTYPSWMIQDVKGVRQGVLILNVHAIFGNREYLDTKLKGKGIEIDITELSDSNVPSFLEKLIVTINTKYPEITIHVAPTVYEGYYKNFVDDLYLTGIVYTYKKEPIETNTIHKKIIENDLRLDYLNFGWYDDLHVSEPLVNQLNLIYVEPFLKLAQYYYSMGDIDSARKWKAKALFLSERAHNEDLIKRINEINW
jgi:hypothetical protein